MNHKHLHLTHSRVAFAPPLQPTEDEVQLILAMRSLPTNVRKALTATTHSQANYYRSKGRPELQLIQCSAGKVTP